MNIKMLTAFALLLTAVLCLSGTAVADEPPDTAALVFFVDYANEAQAEPGESEYSKLIPSVKERFDQALAEAETLITKIKAGDPVSQVEVDIAANNLMDCIQRLSYSASDKTALIELIDECETTYTDESIFTPESWVFYRQALEDAKAARNDENALQHDVDNAYEKLDNGRSQLAMRWIPADKSALIDLVNECETVYTNENKYTPDSWNPYRDALMSAHAVIDDDFAVQIEVDAAYDALNNNRPEPKQESEENKTAGKGSGTGQSTVAAPANNSGPVQNEMPGTSYSNTLEEQTDEEQGPRGVFLFPWLILLVLIIAGVIYCRNNRTSKE